jgi:hypothetical protein
LARVVSLLLLEFEALERVGRDFEALKRENVVTLLSLLYLDFGQGKCAKFLKRRRLYERNVGNCLILNILGARRGKW